MTAYDQLPALIRVARINSVIHRMRYRISAHRTPRCGHWHYIATPDPARPAPRTGRRLRERS